MIYSERLLTFPINVKNTIQSKTVSIFKVESRKNQQFLTVHYETYEKVKFFCNKTDQHKHWKPRIAENSDDIG